jgi:hypothetical protein
MLRNAMQVLRIKNGETVPHEEAGGGASPVTDLSRIFSRSSLAMDANSETTIPTPYIHITAPEKGCTMPP